MYVSYTGPHLSENDGLENTAPGSAARGSIINIVSRFRIFQHRNKDTSRFVIS